MDYKKANAMLARDESFVPALIKAEIEGIKSFGFRADLESIKYIDFQRLSPPLLSENLPSYRRKEILQAWDALAKGSRFIPFLVSEMYKAGLPPLDA
ncbi:hypothetical protein DL93DRAFT_290786 [Clavulina sp. PMI_390]|nr:hypothetical protein DL93DRAFT_290786 [Clavulina sp. PMI_390]